MTEPTADLTEWIKAARSGDPAAPEGLLRQVLPQIEAYVRLNAGQLLRSHESSADVVQSVCRQVIVELDGFRGSGAAQFRSWLSKLALRKIQMRHRFLTAQRRDRRRERPLPAESDTEPDQNYQLLTCYATFCTPSRNASAREEVARIEAAVQQLPDDQRRVLTLACVVGLSHREIARELGKDEPAVRKLLSRARARLALMMALDPNEA